MARDARQPKDKSPDFSAVLVAPCGMDCAVCGAYLAYARNIPQRRGVVSHCAGCRPRGKTCAYLKKNCTRLLHAEVEFCYECPDFPCERLTRIDRRYRTQFGESFIENLRDIQREGMDAFLAAHRAKFRCAGCGGVRCVHNHLCYDCEQRKLARLKHYHS